MLSRPESKQSPASSGTEEDIQATLGLGARPAILARARKWIWLSIAAVVIVGTATFAFRNGTQTTVRYATEPATRGNLTVLVTATGSAQPITQVNVSSELSGTVRKVNVDYNSVVQIGQALAELDTDKLKATVQNSRAKLDSAKAKVADATAAMEQKRADYDRKKMLATRDAASARDLDIAKADYDRAVAQHAMALADVSVAEADLRLNEINLTKACICSPINGIVLKRSVDPGQIVASSLQAPVLFIIAEDLRRMELQVDIDEADVGKVKAAQKATFGVDAYPDRKFPAEIRDIRFGSEIVQGVVTYKAVLTIDNSELLIRPGMTATAEIVVQEVQDALLISNAALRFSPSASGSEGRSPSLLRRLLPGPPSFRPPSKREETGPSRTIWVLRNGVATAVPVVIGATDGRRTVIVEGEITAGEPIIHDMSSNNR
jgi:HlyD family secretion protein